MASLMPFPEPPAAGANVMLGYLSCSGVTSSCRNGNRRLAPDSFSVTGDAGLPTSRPAAGAAVDVVVLEDFDEPPPPHAARARAASNTSGTRRFTIFHLSGSDTGVRARTQPGARGGHIPR